MEKDQLICTKVQLDAFTELRRQLNGNCSVNCPITLFNPYKKKRTIMMDIYCSLCRKHFTWLNPKFLKFTKFIMCPCYSKINLDSIFHRLDELIEELTIQLNKEYSN